jgi:hypothetical protein
VADGEPIRTGARLAGRVAGGGGAEPGHLQVAAQNWKERRTGRKWSGSSRERGDELGAKSAVGKGAGGDGWLTGRATDGGRVRLFRRDDAFGDSGEDRGAARNSENANTIGDGDIEAGAELSNVEHIREEELELSALGALPEEEAAAANAHATGCAECAKKLAEARGRAAALAFGLTQEKPSAAAKEKLFARIAAEREGKSGEAAKRPDEIAALRREVTGDRRKRNWWNWVLVPVAAALALVSLGLWRENERLAREVREARLVAARLQQERVRVERLVHVLAAPETITVKLAGTADTAQSSGIVKYNERTGTVIYTAELPGLPPDKVYQMWLVPVNGAPISAGVFSQAEPGKAQVWSAEVPPNTEPKSFAVTIEPAGGVPQPTGPKVLLGAS